MNTAEIRIAPMDRYEAEQKTGRIRANIEENRRLLKEIYDRGGWKAFNYGSFIEWGKCELSVEKSLLYFMLGAARIDEHLSNGFSTIVEKQPPALIPEGTLRPMGALLEGKKATEEQRAYARAKINEAWSIANERSDGKPTGEIVAEAVDEVLGKSRPLPGQTSFLDEEDDRAPAEPRRNEAGEAWGKMLSEFSTYYTSLQNGGGIGRVARHWAPERKQGYMERCREIGDLFYRIADEIERED